MRPYIEHPALPQNDEIDFMESLGRTRRPNHGEWDDYCILYAPDLAEMIIQAIEDDLLEPEPEEFFCPICEHRSPTFRGITVHLSRSHNIKSERADYFASRKEA